MTVELPATQVEQEVEKRLKQIARTARMDGFRPGKVPLRLVRQRYAQQVEHEVFGELVQSSYFEALGKENITPAGQPRIEPLNKDGEKGYGFVATFEVMPEIKLSGLGDVTIKKTQAEVTDADLEQMIDKLRRQRVIWSDVERPAKSEDRVTINFKGFIDGEAFDGGSAEGVPLVLGSKSMIDGFEDGLVGAKAGDAKTLELKFPEEYRVEKLAGQPATFEVEVLKVQEPQLPVVDEEFAKAFGVEEGGVDALHKEVRANMQRELDEKLQGLLKEQVMNALIERNPLEVPAALVNDEAEALRRQTRANIQQQTGQRGSFDLPLNLFEDQAKRRVVLGLLIAEIVKENGIKVDQGRVRQRVERFAESYENPQEVVDFYYSNREHIGSVENVVLEDQVVEWIAGQVRTEEVPSSFEAVMQPAPAAEG